MAMHRGMGSWSRWCLPTLLASCCWCECTGSRVRAPPLLPDASCAASRTRPPSHMISRVLIFVFLLVAGAGAQTVRIGVFGLFHPQDLSVSPAGNVLIMEIAGQSVALDGHPVRLHLSGDSVAVSVGDASWHAPRVLIHSRDAAAA